MLYQLMLMAQAALEIAVPPSPSERAPLPVLPFDEAQVIIPVSASLRASTLTEVGKNIPPSAPTTVEFVCAVWMEIGSPGACLPPAEASRYSRFEDFKTAATTYNENLDIGTEFVALKRIRMMRLRNPTSASGTHFLMRFSETVSPADAWPKLAPTKIIDDTGLPVSSSNTDVVRLLYPLWALAHDVKASVQVTCRVFSANQLFCRDAKVLAMNNAATADIAFLENAFIDSTYQASSQLRLPNKAVTARHAIGQDVSITVHWSMPEPDG